MVLFRSGSVSKKLEGDAVKGWKRDAGSTIDIYEKRGGLQLDLYVVAPGSHLVSCTPSLLFLTLDNGADRRVV